MIYILLMLILQVSILTPVQTAFYRGDVDMLAKKMESDITIVIEGEGGKRPAQQAALMLKKFFEAHPLKDLKWVHSGSSPNTEYTIGKYIDKNGNEFRVFIVVGKETGRIKQIRISKYEGDSQ
ncbi:MAG: DUF4783 domain-containing protein [Chlorobi bacterium]|nr:DUF4783 domain-containing protein [Chlorobiota bacterium]